MRVQHKQRPHCAIGLIQLLPQGNNRQRDRIQARCQFRAKRMEIYVATAQRLQKISNIQFNLPGKDGALMAKLRDRLFCPILNAACLT